MVRWMATSRIQLGQTLEAIQHAKELVGFGKKHGGPGASVYVDIFGDMNTLRWIADYEDLASFEKIASKVRTDPEFMQKQLLGRDLFIPCSNHP